MPEDLIIMLLLIRLLAVFKTTTAATIVDTPNQPIIAISSMVRKLLIRINKFLRRSNRNIALVSEPNKCRLTLSIT